MNYRNFPKWQLVNPDIEIEEDEIVKELKKKDKKLSDKKARKLAKKKLKHKLKERGLFTKENMRAKRRHKKVGKNGK